MKTKKELLNSLDAMTRSYLETALWASIPYGANHDKSFSDLGFVVAVCSNRMLQGAIWDCRGFQARFPELTPGLYSPEKIGQDLFLSRNRYGVGFITADINSELATRLNRAAISLGELVFSISRCVAQVHQVFPVTPFSTKPKSLPKSATARVEEARKDIHDHKLVAKAMSVISGMSLK